MYLMHLPERKEILCICRGGLITCSLENYELGEPCEKFHVCTVFDGVLLPNKRIIIAHTTEPLEEVTFEDDSTIEVEELETLEKCISITHLRGNICAVGDDDSKNVCLIDFSSKNGKIL